MDSDPSELEVFGLENDEVELHAQAIIAALGGILAARQSGQPAVEHEVGFSFLLGSLFKLTTMGCVFPRFSD